MDLGSLQEPVYGGSYDGGHQWTESQLFTPSYTDLPLNSDVCPHYFAFLDYVIDGIEPFWEQPPPEPDGSVDDPIEAFTDTPVGPPVVSDPPRWLKLHSGLHQ